MAGEGARPGHGTEVVFWDLAFKIEESILKGEPLYGFSLDYGKRFDSLPQAILLLAVVALPCQSCCTNTYSTS